MGPAAWPPAPGADPDDVAVEARERLVADPATAGVAVIDVTAEVGDPWRIAVSLGAPEPGVVAAVATLLAPAQVEVISYVATVEVAEDQEEPLLEANEGVCAVCGAAGPRHPRTVSQIPSSPYAFAGVWPLCATCVERAEAGDETGLLARFRVPDLTDEQSRALARLLCW